MEAITKQLSRLVIVLCLVALCLLPSSARRQNNGSSTILFGTTGSLGGSLLAAAGTCTSGTVSIPGSLVGMPALAVASDGTNIPAVGVALSATVTSNGTVTVSLCALLAVTPTAKTYNVRVIE